MIKTLDIYRDLPPSIATDDNTTAAAKALTEQLKNLNTHVDRLRILATLLEQPDGVLDLLAWQLRVEFYDAGASKEDKAEAIRHSLAWHRIKGTPRAVEIALGRLCDGATVREPWEYGGQPYHFRVDLIESDIQGTENLKNVLTMIDRAKNARSHCEGLGFSKTTTSTVYVGATTTTARDYNIFPAVTRLPDQRAAVYVGGGIYVDKEVAVGG